MKKNQTNAIQRKNKYHTVYERILKLKPNSCLLLELPEKDENIRYGIINFLKRQNINDAHTLCADNIGKKWLVYRKDKNENKNDRNKS